MGGRRGKEGGGGGDSFQSSGLCQDYFMVLGGFQGILKGFSVDVLRIL